MAHVEDRWFRPGPTGRRTVRTDRHGQGQRWLAVWNESDGRRRKKAFDNRDAADDWLARVRAQQIEGTYITRERAAATVRDVARDWVDAHPDWSASTAARNRGILTKHVLPRWGETTVGGVQAEDVQAWVNAMTCAPGTMRRIHQVLSGVLTFAVTRKRIPFNPASHTKFPTATTEPMTVLTVRQVDAFVSAHPERLRLWAKFLAFTGLRVSEAAGLRVRDVDLNRQRVTVREAVVVVDGRKIEQSHVKTETSQGRRVPLVPELVTELAAAVEGKAPRDRVFTARGGVAMNRANYSRREFRDAMAAIGVADVHPHVLRHTAVSLAIASGASVKEVQAIAGHKDASMTLNVYSHLFEDSLDRVSQRMAEYLAAERAGPPRSPQAVGE